MTLARREKILVIATATLVGGLALWFLVLGGDGRTRIALRASRDRLKAEIDKKQARVDAAVRIAKQMQDWEHRALPADLNNARSRYQNWLSSEAAASRFERLNIDPGKGQSRQNIYTLFVFTVRGRASLGDLVEFLHRFYSAGHLHLIRSMELKPVENSRDLDVTIAVEAMSIPSADRKDQLTTASAKVLQRGTLAAYRTPIAERNLFAAYAPRRIEVRTEFDATQYTFVTGIVKDVDGRDEVWLVDRTAGKTLRLHAGDQFRIGSRQGTVQSITPLEAVIEFDGRSRHLASGDKLGEKASRTSPRGMQPRGEGPPAEKPGPAAPPKL